MMQVSIARLIYSIADRKRRTSLLTPLLHRLQDK